MKKRTRRPRSQHENELLGLALLALGLVLAAILYLGLDGGAVGSWLADVLTQIVGNAAYVLPVAFVALGGSCSRAASSSTCARSGSAWG